MNMGIIGYIITTIGTMVFTWLWDVLKGKISDTIAYYKWRSKLDIGYVTRIRFYERRPWLYWMSWFNRFWWFR